MKNSFYLVIPEQKQNGELTGLFQEKALTKWIEELPIANAGLSTRLIFELLRDSNQVKMPAQARLEGLELLRASVLSTQDSLRFRLVKQGFPKTEDEIKIFNVLTEIEKEYTLGYWIAVKEITKREISWFMGKSAAMAVQRAISGLCNIVVSHFLMNAAVPDWVWIDIHSLHRLSIKIKKVSTKVPKSNSEPGKTQSVEDSYKQILLLSLTQPTGLMQKEVLQVFQFLEHISHFLILDDRPMESQEAQCVVLTDEDQGPRFLTNNQVNNDSSTLYLNFSKFNKTLANKDKFINKEIARFSSMAMVKSSKNTLSAELLEYLINRWNGTELQGSPLFNDRLDRCMAIGLESTYQLLQNNQQTADDNLEYVVESTSERALSCQFNNPGLLAIGSLISFRKKNDSIAKRFVGIVNKVISAKSNGKMTFEIRALTNQVFPITYMCGTNSEPQKALIYGMKIDNTDKSYVILDAFNLKEGDVIKLTMNDETFPAILKDRSNIGLGYWQFECRRLEEQVLTSDVKKGYDFI